MNKGFSAAMATGLLATTLSTTAFAKNDFNNLENLAQSQFRTLAENLSAATAYKGVIPAEPLGVTGFDIGVGASVSGIDKAVFEQASDAEWDLTSLPLLRLSAQKGLPLGFDVGASYVMIPGTDARVLGAELRYAFIPGNVILPAISLRGAYSTLQGVDEVELDNKSLDVSISKGFLNFTPYAGVGRVFSTAKAVGVVSLKDEDIEETRVFAGLNINLGINLAIEADSMAGEQSISAKVGLRF